LPLDAIEDVATFRKGVEVGQRPEDKIPAEDQRGLLNKLVSMRDASSGYHGILQGALSQSQFQTVKLIEELFVHASCRIAS
jgi:hypothetical protein